MTTTTTQVEHDSSTQFSLGTFNHAEVEKLTHAVLDDQQENGGGPPIYTLSSANAHGLLSRLQASTKRAVGVRL